MGRVVALLLPGVGYAIVPLILLAIYESELVEVWGGLTGADRAGRYESYRDHYSMHD
jgi:hypothetical protein